MFLSTAFLLPLVRQPYAGNIPVPAAYTWQTGLGPDETTEALAFLRKKGCYHRRLVSKSE